MKLIVVNPLWFFNLSGMGKNIKRIKKIWDGIVRLYYVAGVKTAEILN